MDQNVFWKTVPLKIVFCSALIYILPELEPTGNFQAYEIQEAVELVGPYSTNILINDAEHLYEDLLKGPESLVILNNELYTGVHGGHVIKLSDGRVEKVTKFGLDCDGQWQESKCGRPFGLTSDNKENLYIADAYYGIWKYNINTEKKELLVPHNKEIEGRIPKIFNSVGLSKNGDIYWTDSSTDTDIQNGVYIMFMDGTGRLLKYSNETKENTVLVDNLYFPNGLVISPNEDFIVISEMITSRLLRHYIAGPKKGTTEVFLDGIPGFPDRLKVHSDYITVALVHARDAAEPVLFQNISTRPLLRALIVRSLAFFETFFNLFNKVIPLQFVEKMIHTIGHFEAVKSYAPKRITILMLDWEGNILESWHNLDGTLKAVGDVQIFNGYVYYGSPYNEFVGRTPIPATKLTFEKNVTEEVRAEE